MIKNKPRPFLLISFPCTGGCLLNAGINAKNPTCAPKLEAHWKLFQKLWAQFVKLTDVCGVVPTIVEWPRSCTYWALLRVRKQLKRNNMVFSDFDGCQFGLKAVTPSEDHYLRKPWRFASNSPEVSPEFNGNYCPGQTGGHQHASTRGPNAVHSQYHTPYVTLVIHITLYRHVRGGYNYNYPALQSPTLSSCVSVAVRQTTSDITILPTNSPSSLPRPTMSGNRKRRLSQRDEEDAPEEEERAARGPVPPSTGPTPQQYQLQKGGDPRAGARKGAARGSTPQNPEYPALAEAFGYLGGKGRGRDVAQRMPRRWNPGDTPRGSAGQQGDRYDSEDDPTAMPDATPTAVKPEIISDDEPDESRRQDDDPGHDPRDYRISSNAQSAFGKDATKIEPDAFHKRVAARAASQRSCYRRDGSEPVAPRATSQPIRSSLQSRTPMTQDAKRARSAGSQPTASRPTPRVTPDYVPTRSAPLPPQESYRPNLAQSFEECKTPGCLRPTFENRKGDFCCRTCKGLGGKHHGPECEKRHVKDIEELRAWQSSRKSAWDRERELKRTQQGEASSSSRGKPSAPSPAEDATTDYAKMLKKREEQLAAGAKRAGVTFPWLKDDSQEIEDTTMRLLLGLVAGDKVSQEEILKLIEKKREKSAEQPLRQSSEPPPILHQRSAKQVASKLRTTPGKRKSGDRDDQAAEGDRPERLPNVSDAVLRKDDILYCHGGHQLRSNTIRRLEATCEICERVVGDGKMMFSCR